MSRAAEVAVQSKGRDRIRRTTELLEALPTPGGRCVTYERVGKLLKDGAVGTGAPLMRRFPRRRCVSPGAMHQGAKR